MADRRAGGKTASLGDKEAIGSNAERGVMMESSPTTALIVTQAEFLFQFLVIPFDNPALFGNRHKILQPGTRG
jgi:hypothetical protein